MATSGSVNFTQTRNELILDAFQLLGVYGIGRTVSNEDMQFAVNMLEKMVKAWQARGIHIWSKEEGYLFSAKDTAEYLLGPAATDARATLRTDAVLTELGADEAAAQTSITVDSSTGMAVSDIVGIEQDDKTTHWSTISSITDGTTIVIADALVSAASTNRNVYTFTSRINKPLKVHGVRRKTGIGDNSTTIPMLELSHQEYFDLPNKAISGIPSHYHYDPKIDNGTLYFWPRPNTSELQFEFTFERMLEDFDSAANNADFPTEWLECITYQLAVRIAPAFGKADQLAVIAPLASGFLKELLEWDAETGSIYLMPDRGGM